MPSIRKTKTGSGSTAVQVVRYENRKVIILKHIGSAKTSKEINVLIEGARIWIEKYTQQLPLLPGQNKSRILPIANIKYLGVNYTFARKVLLKVAEICGFDTKKDSFLLDFAIMRILEPASKLRSIELMNRYFGVHYSRRDLYRLIPHFCKRKKNHRKHNCLLCKE